MEILPGVHRLESEVGGRPLYQYLLVGARCALVDAGFSTTPDELVFPYLASLGRTPADLALVLVTHADTDHHGGIGAIKAAAPAVEIGCGAADRPLVEDVEALIALRYDAYRAEHGLGYDDDVLAAVRELSTPAATVDHAWSGGERIVLEAGWELEVMALPGHSHGHVGFLDLRHRVAYIGDAVHGARYPGYDGTTKLPPNYLAVRPYLDTIARLESTEAGALHSAHWPACSSRADIAAFLAESRTYVDRIDAAVVSALEAADDGLTLEELMAAVNERLDRLPPPVAAELTYSVAAHVDELGTAGRLAVTRRAGRAVHALR